MYIMIAFLATKINETDDGWHWLSLGIPVCVRIRRYSSGYTPVNTRKKVMDVQTMAIRIRMAPATHIAASWQTIVDRADL